MRIVSKLITLVSLFLFGVASVNAQTESWTEMNKGQKHFNQGDFEAAERCFDKALQLDSTNARARYNLGDTYLAQGDAENALKSYQRVAKEAKDSDKSLTSKSLHNMGVINQSAAGSAQEPEMKQRMLQNAINNYKEALRLNPNADDSRYNMVLCMKQLKESEQNQSKDQEKDDKSKNESEQKEQKPQPKDKEQKQDKQDPQTEQLLNYARQKEQQAKEKMKVQPVQRSKGKNW